MPYGPLLYGISWGIFFINMGVGVVRVVFVSALFPQNLCHFVMLQLLRDPLIQQVAGRGTSARK